jgi:hypothetical protein
MVEPGGPGGGMDMNALLEQMGRIDDDDDDTKGEESKDEALIGETTTAA